MLAILQIKFYKKKLEKLSGQLKNSERTKRGFSIKFLLIFVLFCLLWPRKDFRTAKFKKILNESRKVYITFYKDTN